MLKDALRRFFSNPVVGIIGSFASVVGVVLAIMFYLNSAAKPDLVYSVHPIRTIFVQGAHPGELKVEFRGEPLVDTDIVSMRIALWNAGRGSIRSINVLRPVWVSLGDRIRILEASLVKQSRDVVELDLLRDRESSMRGSFRVSWKILEEGDGAVIQVIYAGAPDVRAKIDGVIEGQGPPRELERRRVFPGLGQLSTEQRDKGRGWALGVIWVTMILFVVGTVMKARVYSRSRRIRLAELAAAGVMFIATVAVSIDVWLSRTPTPPFGF